MSSSGGRSSLIGVCISLISNILISLALNCQKLAHVRLEREEDDKQGSHITRNDGGDEESQRLLINDNSTQSTRQYGGNQSGSQKSRRNSRAGQEAATAANGSEGRDHAGKSSNDGMSTTFLRSRLWWLGICLMTLGEMGNFTSYGFAPASLVAPLGAVALLANVVFSPLILKERFHPSDLGGILLAIIGAVTVVFSSKQDDVTLNPDELWTAICRKEFIAYTIIAIGLAASLVWGSTTALGQRFVLLDVGVCAVLGGFTVLSTKGLSSLLSQGQLFELLEYPITYGLIIVLAGTALAQITFLNRALQRFDSREVIPTQFVMFTISAIVGSAILYQDFANMDAHRLINFLFGCMTTFAGVYFLTNTKDEDTQEDEEAYTNEERDTAVPVQGSERILEEDANVVPAIAPPSRARPLLVGKRGSKGYRALTTGSVPSLANTANQNSASLVALAPANGSFNSSNGSVPKYIITRRSIFNPAFPVAFIDNSNRRI